MRASLVVLALLLTVLTGCTTPSGPPAETTLPAAMLLAEPYPFLVVELDHAPGLEPGPGALAAFEDALETLTSKERVVLQLHEDERLAGGVEDRRDLVRLHRATADIAPTTPGVHGRGDVAVLHVMYVAGRLDDAVATAISAEGTIALFPEAFEGVDRLVDGKRLSAAPLIEEHALLHELGHAFGLVGHGIPMVRDRPTEKRHSTNPDSVMFHSIQIREGLLHVQPSLHFDDDDLRDLHAFRGVPAPPAVLTIKGDHAPAPQDAAAARGVPKEGA